MTPTSEKIVNCEESKLSIIINGEYLVNENNDKIFKALENELK